MTKDHADILFKAVDALCDVLKKHYPKIFEQRYDEFGQPFEDYDGSTFEQRMQMGVHIELIKAGAYGTSKQPT